MNTTSCCVPPLPLVVLGNAFLAETYSVCVKLRNGATLPHSPQCAGCAGFVTLESCERECNARSDCAFYQFEPLVEHYHNHSSDTMGMHQCAYNCAVEGLTERVCDCGKCALFGGNTSVAQFNTSFAQVSCKNFTHGKHHSNRCGSHGPSVCRRATQRQSTTRAVTRAAAQSVSTTTTEQPPTSPKGYVLYVAVGLLLSVLVALAIFIACLQRKRNDDEGELIGAFEMQAAVKVLENTYEEPVPLYDNVA